MLPWERVRYEASRTSREVDEVIEAVRWLAGIGKQESVGYGDTCSPQEAREAIEAMRKRHPKVVAAILDE